MSDVNVFIPPYPLKTAVLFLIFNRPNTTKLVFDAIRNAKPPRLYIAADGPRRNVEGEVDKVRVVRDYVMASIDWPCEIKVLFNEENQGCKVAVSSAITWFFDHEEMGIILEDDCLPSQSFFWYCEELLQRYMNDERIFMISGCNLRNGWKSDKLDYFYSKYGGIWGWASWKRAWTNYTLDISLFNEVVKMDLLEGFYGKNAKGRIELFRAAFNGKIDTWDYQWGFARAINSGLAIVPSQNLISNIGFGPEATHTLSSDVSFSSLKTLEITLPLKDNQIIIPDDKYDKIFCENKTLIQCARLLMMKCIKYLHRT